MNSWTWTSSLSPRVTAWTPPKSPPWFGNTAPHIRGKVRIRGHLVCFEVVNTRTGTVIASDNVALHTRYGSGLPTIVQDCIEATAAARGAWTYDFKRKDLK